MARMVRHSAIGPFKIEPQDFPKDGKSIWICGCGLSRTLPYCDGTHKTCCGEVQGTLYVYDAERANVIETKPETC